MSNITIRNKNHSFLHVDCEPSVGNEIADFFTFYVPGYKFMPMYKNKIWDGKIRLYDIRTKELPAGLLTYLQEFAGAEGRDYTLEIKHDNYYGTAGAKNQIDISFLKDMVVSAAGKQIFHNDHQTQSIQHAIENKRALIVSPTGSGKSLIIYSIIRWYLENKHKKVLIIVPTTSLVEQMYKDFADYSEYDNNFDHEKICHRIYSGREKITDKKIIISTWQSVYKLNGQWFEPFGMIFGDEAHNFKAKSLVSILSKCREAEYRFGTTGTLDGTQTHKLVLEGYFGPVYYATTTKKLQDEGILSDLDIDILLLKYPPEICQAVTKMKYKDEIDYIVRNEKRNKLIANLALDQDGNTLVLFQFVEKHGKPLHTLIRDKAHERRKVFFVSGTTDVETREQIRQITEKEKNAVIVASIGTFSTGINIRNLHNIIFASPSKSQIRVLQSIGRGLRKSDDGRGTKLYDFADDLHWKGKRNFTLNHSAERIKIYSREKFKYKIFEVDL